jgi:hypothetical protein
VPIKRIRRGLRGTKDAALALAARAFLNVKLQGIGAMNELSVDTKKRAFRLQLDLLGEAEPIEIYVKKYELARHGRTTTLTVLDASASRKWLAEALRQFVVGQRFNIPAKAGAVLKLFT